MIKGRLIGLLMLLTMLVAACHGSGDNGVQPAPPAGLAERDGSVVYAGGTEIIPNMPSSSGGAIGQFSVSPALPVGLSLNPQTGVITGTPTSVSNATEYTVTGTNATGSASARVEIEVKDHVIAPETLGYLDSSVIYVTNQSITPNTPITTGGEITQYSVSPALPAGLTLDPQTGVITGTPTAVTAPAIFTVTGSNSVDSIDTQLGIEVQAQFVPPVGLTYVDPVPVYIVGRPIVVNEPQYSGGEITRFTVSPALPGGLSIDALTGAISGMPTTTGVPTTYTVTGSNSAGSVTAQLTIDVNTAVIGEWLPADYMNLARYRHTASLLPDGRVLVAGGIGSKGRLLSSAELYAPAADTWSQTGNLNQARFFHTATLLPTGRVLVAGGIGGTQLSSAELYDPAAGTWAPTGSMSQARDSHTATLLSTGRVLVAGGRGTTGTSLSSAELYDPVAGTWAQTGSLVQARYSATATVLADGRVLVAGGTGSAGLLSSAELYDPATGTWSQTGNMAQARSLHTAMLLPDGKVLVAGGNIGGTAALATAELYDPATGTWSQTASMSQARYFFSATLLPDGRVLAAGGVGSPVFLSSADLYDPAAGTWSRTASLGQPRNQQSATLLPDGRVLAEGGLGPGFVPLSSSELFH
ncbi:putative Ig domain-containing protein [Paraburkholderia sp. CNPSo 3076]|uniref:kelch repeat-containing protein n=1 Tax=Paraburkholderia sp. CNPSo 3076 TaxID=2940936 RepID=UPI00225C3AB6|nr:kelch repeat-containing protein [Paraburkholderia sp. CNPSo 3076]MCX5542397.1 putative Ig domain-containing protein [Paraburkholderia sp. CNPSo 3076]